MSNQKHGTLQDHAMSALHSFALCSYEDRGPQLLGVARTFLHHSQNAAASRVFVAGPEKRHASRYQ